MTRIQRKKYHLDYYTENGNVIIDMLTVYPEYRNQGVATKAMTFFNKKFAGKNCELHAFGQEIDTDTNRLVSFYEKFGFEVVAGSEEIGFEMKN